MKIVYANNPKWANRSQTKIDLTVRFEEIEEDLPFTASQDDCEQHGKELFTRALSGEFGEISELVPVEFTSEMIVEALKAERNTRLTATDWTQLPDVPQNVKNVWATYRQELRDLTNKEGFPWYNIVVLETDYGFTVDLAKAPWPVAPQ
jgi:hypothetical protein